MISYKLKTTFKELFDKFPDSFNITEGFVDEVFDFFDKINTNKYKLDEDSELEEVIILYICEWAFRSAGSLSNSASTIQNIVIGFFVQISNTLTCILRLAKDGYDYQATILIRNLIDISYTLLTLMVDEECRTNFLEAARTNNEKTIWYKYFRFEKMEKTIWKYISSIGDENEIDFIKGKGSEIYHWLSSFVHNDFKNIFLYSYSESKDENEVIKINLQGQYVSRVSTILMMVIEIMFFIDLLFMRMLYDDNNRILKADLCKETDGKIFWNQSIALHFITRDYVLLLEENKGGMI